MKPEPLCEQEQSILEKIESVDYEVWHSPLVHRLERGQKND